MCSSDLLLDNHGIKRVPVVERGRLVGVVSRGDLVRCLAKLPSAPRKGRITDAQISVALQRELDAADGVDKAMLNFAVANGVVDLSGYADEKQSRAAEALAASVPGVRKVKNSIMDMPRLSY